MQFVCFETFVRSYCLEFSFFFVLESVFCLLSAFFVLGKCFPRSVFFLVSERVFFPLMILSILFNQKYPILFVALNFADMALIVSLSQTGCYNGAGGTWKRRAYSP